MRITNLLRHDAPIAIVYGMPSVESEAAKKEKGTNSHFLSKSEGSFLYKLSGANINISDCSILSVVQDRHFSIEHVSKKELELWHELLRRDLAKLSPNVTIAVGDTAIRALTALPLKKHEDAAESLRGYVFPSRFDGSKVIGVMNITYADVARPEWHPFMQWDLAKAKRNAKSKDFLCKDIKVTITNDLELLASKLISPEIKNLAFDIECCGSELTCIGFATSATEAYTIPLRNLAPSVYAATMRLIQEILLQPCRKIAQNGNFDVFYLAHYYGIQVVNFSFDTMIASHCMFPNLPKGLGVLGSIYTEEMPWKDDNGANDE